MAKRVTRVIIEFEDEGQSTQSAPPPTASHETAEYQRTAGDNSSAVVRDWLAKTLGSLTETSRQAFRRIPRYTAVATPAQTEVKQSPLHLILLIGAVGMALAGSIALRDAAAAYAQAIPSAGWLLLVGAAAYTLLLPGLVQFKSQLTALPDPQSRPRAKSPNQEPLIARLSKTAQRFVSQNRIRLALMALGLFWTNASINENTAGNFTLWGVVYWFLSIITWLAALQGNSVSLRQWLARTITLPTIPQFPPRLVIKFTPRRLVFVAILVVGAYFIFTDLATIPPDMDSDHVEKILDAYSIARLGVSPIFMYRNGGRESMHFYFLAALSNLSGHSVDFDLLKIATGLEGMLMLVLCFWLGQAVFGEEDAALGILTGTLMALMVATSWWHIMLARNGLRMVLMGPATTLVIIFTVRALRHNRRLDYLLTGLALGFSLYTYQSSRMLPVMVTVGIAIALVVRARPTRSIRTYLVNFVALVLIAFVVAVPLISYALYYPEFFWSRVISRVVGDGKHVFSEGGENPVPYVAQNVVNLAQNLQKAVLMFNWRGDNTWFYGSPGGQPALDYFSGTLFVLGVGTLVVRMRKRRDPVDFWIPVATLIMLLPTALSVANLAEVPSSSRAGGSLPLVYLTAAIGLAVMLRYVFRPLNPKIIAYAGYVVLAGLFVVGASNNHDIYFQQMVAEQYRSTYPYDRAGHIARDFIASNGSLGNVYLMASNYWWDQRALGIEVGDYEWEQQQRTILMQGTDATFKVTIERAAGTPLEFRPDRPVLVFYNVFDPTAPPTIQRLFPNGYSIQIPGETDRRNFMIYMAPPPGCDWLRAITNKPSLYCK